MKAFILAGGSGTRLGEIGKDTPKVMLPVQGITILEHQFNLLKAHGVTEAVLSVGYMSEKIKAYVGDGRDFGMRVSYVEDGITPLGTAGGLRLARDYFEGTFVMMNGDELKEIDLKRMLRAHQDAGGLATIALTRVDDPKKFGVVRLDGSRIVEFLEKPEHPPTNLINSGLYILEPGIIDRVPEGKASIERDVFQKLAPAGVVHGYPFEGQWFPTDTLEKYDFALKQWKDPW